MMFTPTLVHSAGAERLEISGERRLEPPPEAND
jgi:hypothetical protein